MGGSNFCRSAWKLFSVSVANTIFTGSSSVAYQKMTKIITFREEQGGKACRLFVSGCTAGSTVCLAIKCWAAGWYSGLANEKSCKEDYIFNGVGRVSNEDSWSC